MSQALFRRTTCPDGTVLDPGDFAAAHQSLSDVERADTAWEADIANPELQAAYWHARAALREANRSRRGKPFPCWKCNPQTGRIIDFSHVAHGTCFACGGTGHRPFAGYRPRSSPAARARRREQQEHAEADRRRRAVEFWLKRSPMALAGLLRLSSSADPVRASAHQRISALLHDAPESVNLPEQVARALAKEPPGLPADPDEVTFLELIHSTLTADWPDDLARAGYLTGEQADQLKASAP